MRKVQIVRLCIASGMCMSAVSFAQGPAQPQVHFWEPPKAAIQLRPQFGPMVRVLLCNGEETANDVVFGGDPADIILANGLGAGCGNPPGYSVESILRRWHDPDGNLSTTWNWVGPNRNSLFLQNVKLTQHRLSSLTGKDGFLDERDREILDVDLDGNGFPDLPFTSSIGDENIRRNLPFFLYGRQFAHDFWIEVAGNMLFLEQDGLSVPKRLHLDIEHYSYKARDDSTWLDLGLTSAFEQKAAYMLYALPHEDFGHKPEFVNGAWQLSATADSFITSKNRWNNLPVPGFGNNTLADLWNQVKPSFGNRPTPLYEVQSSPLVNYDPSNATSFAQGLPWQTVSTNNRGVFMWWSSICSRALAAAHTESAVQAMQPIFPDIKASNYDLSYIRPGDYDFGWYQKVTRTANSNNPVIAPARIGRRGFPDSYKHSAKSNRTELKILQNQGGTTEDYEWLNYETLDKVGDMSAPVLYALGTVEFPGNVLTRTWLDYQSPDFYRPTHPVENRWLSSLRWHRWQLESIISSEGQRAGGTPWTLVAPWVPVPNGEAQIFNARVLNNNSGPCNLANEANGTPSNGCYSASAYLATEDDVHRQQALLRSKRITEMMAFNPRGLKPRTLPTDANWSNMPALTDGYAELERVYKRVYEPQIVEIVYDSQGTLSVVDDINPAVQEFSSGFAVAAQDAVEDTNERWQAIGGTPTTYQGKQKRLRAQAGRNSSDPTAVVTKINFAAQVTPAGTNQLPACEMLRFTLECDVTMNNPCEILSSNGQPCGAPMHLEGRVRLLNPTGGYGADLELAQQDCDGAGGQPAFFEVNGGVNYYGFGAPRTSTTDVTQILSTPNPCKAVDDTVNRVTGSFNVQMRRTFDVDVPSNVMSSLIDSAGRIRFDLLVRARSFGQNFTSDASMTVDWNLIQVTRMGRPNTYCANGDNPNDTPIGGGEGAAMAGSTMMVDGGDTPADVNLDDAVDLLDLQVLLDAQTRAQPSGDYNSDGLQDDIDVVELIEDIADAV